MTLLNGKSQLSLRQIQIIDWLIILTPHYLCERLHVTLLQQPFISPGGFIAELICVLTFLITNTLHSSCFSFTELDFNTIQLQWLFWGGG